MKAIEVSKNNLMQVSFYTDEVLTCDNKRIERIEKLKKAMVSGNALKHKVKIIFKCNDGLRTDHQYKFVETTVWFVSDKHVVLKGGMVIPICCIYDVIL